MFVANSAGNAGPGVSTVGSPGVGAVADHGRREHARGARSTRRSPSPARAGAFTIKGASVTDALPATPLVDAATANRAGVTSSAAELCKDNTLDAAKVTGKVVLCLRGTTPASTRA